MFETCRNRTERKYRSRVYGVPLHVVPYKSQETPLVSRDQHKRRCVAVI